MSQNKQMILSSQSMEVGPLLVNELFRDENIPIPSFSFGFLGFNDEEQAFVDFGEPDRDRVKGGEINDETTVTLGFNDDFFWSTFIQAIKFDDALAYAIEGSPYTIFDTGSSHIMVPPLLLEPIVEGIIAATGNRAQYAIQQGTVFVDCTQRYMFKSMEMMFSEYYLIIEPSNYIWDVYGDGQVCTMLITANSYDFFLLGQPIYQGYYTMHHMRESTIGYAPLNGFLKDVPQRAPIPNEVMVPAEPPSFAEQYGSLIFLILCVLFAAYVIQPILVGKWDENDPEDEWKFIAAYVAYGLFCLAIFIFLIQPLFKLPALDLGNQRFHAIGFFTALGGVHLRSKSAAKKRLAAPKTKKTVQATDAIEMDTSANQLI